MLKCVIMIMVHAKVFAIGACGYFFCPLPLANIVDDISATIFINWFNCQGTFPLKNIISTDDTFNCFVQNIKATIYRFANIVYTPIKKSLKSFTKFAIAYSSPLCLPSIKLTK